MKILMIITLFITAGCSSLSERTRGDYIVAKNVNSSVKALFKAFQFAVPGGNIRGRSKNGRTVVSGYHPVKGDPYEDATNMKNRAYAKLSIRGHRRPYTLRIQYMIQKQNESGVHKTTKYDRGKAQRVLVKMRKYLASRPDRNDFIDDFRAF